ncbi:MAG: putative aminopeptidase FrvX [Saprospiraceae bacterium]|jgi:putative aminopeptidase FrvX
MDLSLLKQLCAIKGVSGDESRVKSFILSYVKKHSSEWKFKPVVVHGDEIQDAVLLVFGEPRVAVFSHMDTVGYSVAYGSNLIKIGGPSASSGAILVGEDSVSEIECRLDVDDEGTISYLYNRSIDRGTCLSYQENFIEDESHVQSPYLDNRLGVFVALKLAETMRDGVLAFSCYEETGGGNAEVLARVLYDRYKVRQALVCDITWVTSGVQHGNGVAVSMRDSGIPRKTYLNKVLQIAQDSAIDFQLEVESSGGSDGNALQKSPYPFDWCFIGAAEDHVHSPHEKVAIKDIDDMISLYIQLVHKL